MNITKPTAKTEIEEGKRFEFGKNWHNFLSGIDNERIIQAQKSIKEFLQINSLAGLSFLDVGCGSGLFRV
jgi:2-polyprenyl-6-hydroxyphenyl methylase/3-demethylubiquinone-9 3-methyltransferase